MADTRTTPAADGPPAAAIRALRDAIAGLGRQLLAGDTIRQNSNTVIHMLGASHADAQALHEYLSASLKEP